MKVDWSGHSCKIAGKSDIAPAKVLDWTSQVRVTVSVVYDVASFCLDYARGFWCFDSEDDERLKFLGSKLNEMNISEDGRRLQFRVSVKDGKTRIVPFLASEVLVSKWVK